MPGNKESSSVFRRCQRCQSYFSIDDFTVLYLRAQEERFTVFVCKSCAPVLLQDLQAVGREVEIANPENLSDIPMKVKLKEEVI